MNKKKVSCYQQGTQYIWQVCAFWESYFSNKDKLTLIFTYSIQNDMNMTTEYSVALLEIKVLKFACA